MNKQEAIEELNKKYNAFLSSPQPDGPFLEGYISASITAKSIINQIDEPQKVVIPKFVAEWIEIARRNEDLGFMGLFDFSESSYDELSYKVLNWAEEDKNSEKLARAWLDGYDIEQEKLYTVEIPNPNYSDSDCKTVLRRMDENIIELTVFLSPDFKEDKFQLTESEIKKDFEWAWQFAKEVKNDSKI